MNDYLLDANWKLSASKSESTQKIIPVSHVDEIAQPVTSKPTKKALTINKDILAIGVIYGAIFLLVLVFIIFFVYILKGRSLASNPVASQTSTITYTPDEIAFLNPTLNNTNTPLPTITILPSYSPSPTMTASPSQTPSPTATQTPTLTPTPTRTRTPKLPSKTPTLRPVIPTDTPIPPTEPPTPTVYVPPPVVLESCGVDPSSIQPGFTVILVFTADFSAPGYGFDTDLSPGFPGQNGCSGVDDNGDGTASCNGSSGLLPQSTTVTVTFKSPVGNCVASYGTP